MAGHQSIRGSRIGSGPMGEQERGDSAARVVVSFWCAAGHQTRPSFSTADGVVVPEVWDCTRCGLPAGRDRDAPPAPPRTEVYKSHLDYVKERRTDDDGEKILSDALQALRERRGQ